MEPLWSCACGTRRALLCLFYCPSCHGLKCDGGACTEARPDVCYCPSCWHVSFPTDGARTGMSCPSCSICDRCGLTERRPMTVGAAAAAGCSRCGGTSDDAGAASDALASTIALLRRSRALQTASIVVVPRRCEAEEGSKKSGAGGAAWALGYDDEGDSSGAVVGSAANRAALPSNRGSSTLRDSHSASPRSVLAAAPRCAIGVGADAVGWSAPAVDGNRSAPRMPASAALLGGAEERRLLAGTAAGYGLSSTGAASHAMLDAAAGRALAVSATGSRHLDDSDGGAVDAVAIASLEAADGARGSRRAPPPLALEALAAGLEARRAAMCARLLSSGLPEAEPAAAHGARAPEPPRRRPARLRAMHSRRCCECKRIGLPGLLTSPNAAPLRLLATGARPERGLAATWFRKTSPAATLLPRIQILAPQRAPGAAASSGAFASPPPPHAAWRAPDAGAALLSGVLAHLAAALRHGGAGARADGAGADAAAADIEVSVPVVVRLSNPVDAVIVVALLGGVCTSSSSSSGGGGGSGRAPPLPTDSRSTAAAARGWLALPARLVFDTPHPVMDSLASAAAAGAGAEGEGAAGSLHACASSIREMAAPVEGATAAAAPHSGSCSGATALQAALRSALAASAGGPLIPSDSARVSTVDARLAAVSAPSLALAALSEFDEYHLGDDLSAAEAAAATARAATALLVDGAAPGDAALLERLLRESAPATLQRWRHVLALRATLRFSLPAALGASLRGAGAAGSRLSGISLHLATAAAVLLPAAPLAALAGTAQPLPAAAACVLVAEQHLELSLPLVALADEFA